jgi:hypothetical protein
VKFYYIIFFTIFCLGDMMYRPIVWVIFTALFLIQTAHPQNPTVRIMPLGDSITESRKGHASYRCWLWDMLRERGISADFVGSRSGVMGSSREEMADADCPYSDFDPEHEGHFGWCTSDFLDEHSSIGCLHDWLNLYTPDIVLVHLGTNDVGYGKSIDEALDRLGGIIDTLRHHNPSIVIFLAKLISSTRSWNSRLPEFNDRIPEVCLNSCTDFSPVIMVDHNSGFDPAEDTFDGVHPDSSGEYKMAQKWSDAIENFLYTSAHPAAKRIAYGKPARQRNYSGIVVDKQTNVFMMRSSSDNTHIFDLRGRSLTPSAPAGFPGYVSESPNAQGYLLFRQKKRFAQ